MKPLNFNLDCPKCGNHFIARFTELEDDDTITCPCGYDFPLNETQRAELARVLKERNDEIRKIFADVTNLCGVRPTHLTVRPVGDVGRLCQLA